MAKHDHTPAPSPVTRRAPPPNPDAELIRLCAEFDGYERQRLALFDRGKHSLEIENRLQPEVDALADRQEPLLDEIWDRPPQTPEGWRALAATLVLWAPDYLDADAGWDEVLRATLLRGLVGEGVALPLSAPRTRRKPSRIRCTRRT